MTSFKYGDITEKIIGAAFRVHAELKNGYQEVIHQRALTIEFAEIGLQFNREFEMPIFYKGKRIGTRRVDFFVCRLISVEIKAVAKLLPEHITQTLNYLEAYNIEVGLLINFGSNSLDVHRLTNKKYKPIQDPNNPNP
ncbi:MAG: GxxExxY protein [Chitinophagaceae bacterium]|nr:GxxExxY protein [Chitinophagaceae bacterium]